jgi:hypothetical protein
MRGETADRGGNAACAHAVHRQPIAGTAPFKARVEQIDFVRVFGSPGWIRTSDHPINSRMLYR